jgi:signal transduction histidine kinase/ActR/RegA family two-component response regulator
MWSIGNKIMLGYAVCMAALIVFGVAALVVLTSLAEALRQRGSQREMLLQLYEVFSGLQDAETAQRGFVLTGNPDYLEPYEKARQKVPLHLAQLEILSAGRQNSADIQALRLAAAAKMEHVEQVVGLRREKGFEEASALVATGVGKRLMDAVRARMEVLENEEKHIFSRLIKASEQNTALLRGIILWGVPAAICLLALTGVLVSRHITEPITRITWEAGRIENGNLSTPLPPSRRTDEVGRLIRSFESMRASLEENRVQLLARNETLSALNNQLEELTRAKSEFLAMMSHEIRTPLHGLVGYSNLLAETPLDERQRDYLSTIRASARSLLTVINDVLDFSKIEAGKLLIEREVFEIPRCLKEICELFRPAASDNGTEIEWAVDPALPIHALGDSSRLRQVLSNLVSNAVKFTRGGRVSVTASRRDLPGNPAFYLQITVEDNGIGIPPEKRGQLFHSFEQLGASTSRKHGGTGLGLAISKRLCELMGGSIRVDEQTTEGTTFHFEVRLEPVSEQDMQSAGGIASATLATLDDDQLRGSRVLIAEDNPVNASLLSIYLKKHGLAAAVAVNGHQAVDRAAEADLIFMDVQMPEMDGVEAAEAIRRRHGDGTPYIIALTAEAMKGDADRCLAAGMNDYLPKPFNPRDLDLALVKYCSHRTGLAS